MRPGISQQLLSLNGGTQRHYFIGIQVVEQGFAKEGCHRVLHHRHAGRAAHHYHALYIGG